MTKPHIRDLHRRRHARDDDDLVVPVELVSFARRKTQWHIGRGCRHRTLTAPSRRIAAHRVISAAITETLQFLVGSHLWGRRFVPRKFVDATPYAEADHGFELVPDIEAEREKHRIVSFDIEPGDVLAFHFRTLHTAPGTAGRTPYRRRALSLRYVGDDATFALRQWLHSPPFTADGLTVGGPLDDPRFPLIAPRLR